MQLYIEVGTSENRPHKLLSFAAYLCDDDKKEKLLHQDIFFYRNKETGDKSLGLNYLPVGLLVITPPTNLCAIIFKHSHPTENACLIHFTRFNGKKDSAWSKAYKNGKPFLSVYLDFDSEWSVLFSVREEVPCLDIGIAVDGRPFTELPPEDWDIVDSWPYRAFPKDIYEILNSLEWSADQKIIRRQATVTGDDSFKLKAFRTGEAEYCPETQL